MDKSESSEHLNLKGAKLRSSAKIPAMSSCLIRSVIIGIALYCRSCSNTSLLLNPKKWIQLNPESLKGKRHPK